MEYIVVLTQGRCLVIALDEARELRLAELDDDLDLYVEDELSEEFDFTISNMQWSLIEEGQFYSFGKVPKFLKAK